MIDPAVGYEVDDLGVARLHRQQRRQIDVDERLGQPQLLHVLQTAVQRLDARRLRIRFIVDAASVKQIGNIHRAAQSRLEPARQPIAPAVEARNAHFTRLRARGNPAQLAPARNRNQLAHNRLAFKALHRKNQLVQRSHNLQNAHKKPSCKENP